MFTTPCIIRKNTTELRRKLEELGYHCNQYLEWDNMYTSLRGYDSVYSINPNAVNEILNNSDMIDCGENEELFLAISALRDDSSKNQWFTDGQVWAKCGNTPFFCNSKRFHKASVEELIEHFKR